MLLLACVFACFVSAVLSSTPQGRGWVAAAVEYGSVELRASLARSRCQLSSSYRDRNRCGWDDALDRPAAGPSTGAAASAYSQKICQVYTVGWAYEVTCIQSGAVPLQGPQQVRLGRRPQTIWTAGLWYMALRLCQ